VLVRLVNKDLGDLLVAGLTLEQARLRVEQMDVFVLSKLLLMNVPFHTLLLLLRFGDHILVIGGLRRLKTARMKYFLKMLLVLFESEVLQVQHPLRSLGFQC
jgi:hypothetical protein